MADTTIEDHQLDTLIASFERRHGALVAKGRSIRTTEYLDLHFASGKAARLSRDLASGGWTVERDPDAPPPKTDVSNLPPHIARQVLEGFKREGS